MAANVVMSSYGTLLILDQKEWEARLGDLNIISDVQESLLMGHHDPFFGEDRSSLKLEHCRRSVPRGRQCSNGDIIVSHLFFRGDLV